MYKYRYKLNHHNLAAAFSLLPRFRAPTTNPNPWHHALRRKTKPAMPAAFPTADAHDPSVVKNLLKNIHHLPARHLTLHSETRAATTKTTRQPMQRFNTTPSPSILTPPAAPGCAGITFARPALPAKGGGIDTPQHRHRDTNTGTGFSKTHQNRNT